MTETREGQRVEEERSSGQRASRIVEAIEGLVDAELAALVEQREACRAALGRIRAAAESDADLQKLPALRDFLFTETRMVEHTSLVIGHGDCTNGWGPGGCTYTGGCYCEREGGHKGRCRCSCGSTRTPPNPTEAD